MHNRSAPSLCSGGLQAGSLFLRRRHCLNVVVPTEAAAADDAPSASRINQRDEGPAAPPPLRVICSANTQAILGANQTREEPKPGVPSVINERTILQAGYRMKPRWRTPTIIIVVLIVGFFAFRMRFRIEAKVWHWRHGYSLNVGIYQVPVPDGWLVQDYDTPNMFMLINTHLTKTSDPFSSVSIVNVSLVPSAPRDLDAWASMTRQSFERQGLNDLKEQSIQAGDETIVCLGGQILRAMIRVPSLAAVSMECRSSGRLNLGFSGPESALPEFYKIMSEIHKKKQS
jgi:hypothetical protein